MERKVRGIKGGGNYFFFVGRFGIFFDSFTRTVSLSNIEHDWIDWNDNSCAEDLFNLLDFSREDLGWTWNV